MDKRLEEKLETQGGDISVIEEKIDLALELLGKIGDTLAADDGGLSVDEIGEWKQRCRARAAARRSRRR